MLGPMKIIGAYVSPYVRKVLACLNLKGLAYEIDPIAPFFGDDSFEAMSPLRRVPVLVDGDLTLCDSSVICAYLDEAYPGRPLLPADVKDRARARWLEEYADTRLGDVLIWGYFYPLVLQPAIFGAARDRVRAEKNIRDDVPGVLDYLERQVSAEGFLFGELGLADISLAAPFRNAALARFSIDAARWPKAAAYVDRVLAHPAVATLRPYEEVQLTRPLGEQSAALTALGARLAARSVATAKPRPGVMAI
jgi:glutathione S-transferase